VTVEEILADRLAALAPVVALVGSRVFLDKLPGNVGFPAVLVQLVDDLDGYHLRGKNKPQRARVQVDAYVRESSGVDPYAQVVALAEAIDGDGEGPAASGLAGWKGRVGSPPVVIHSCFRTSRLRRYDPDELNLLRMSQDYIVSYTGT
jgi:hypothetical protein